MWMINKFLQSELQCQRVVSADETFDEFNSSWPTSDGDTAELHMYYENFNDHMRNRPNGMSEATTIVVDT